MAAVTIDTIFCNMITLLGYEKALQLVEQSKPVKVETTTIVETKKEEEKKRIPRMSPAITGHLTTELKNAGLELNDKLKKEFIAYVNNLIDTDFASKGLIDHMRDFANTKKPTVETVVVKAEEKPKKEKAKKKGDDKVTVVKAPEVSNAVGTTQITLSELQKRNVATPERGLPVGTYYDTENGQYITGPDHEDDEWLDPVEFGGKTYMVSNRSGRVYIEGKGDDHDIFHGFVGVGKFSDMKMDGK